MLVMKMDKVLVKVYVPMLEGIYDVWIPSNKRIHEIIVLLVKAIFELSEGCYNPSKMPSLYDKITAEEFDFNSILKDTTVRNGTEVILI